MHSQVVDPENIRLTIAKQGSVGQSVALLLRAFCTAVNDAVDEPNPERLVQLARHIDDNPKAWIDAIMANTPQAEETEGISLVQLDTNVRDAFAEHGVRQQERANKGNGEGDKQHQAPPRQSQPHQQQDARR
jgi:hypothetical protein